jgi:RNA polymerase sigma-70 factor (ECF subfamily)
MTVLDEIEATIPSLRRYAHALVRDREAADDLVQDCLERAVARRRDWRGDGPVRAWLFRILLNLHRDTRRGAAARAVLLTIQPGDEPHGSGGQEEHLDLSDVHAAMDRLPADQRAALLLVALEGMTLAEAARVLGIAEGTIASRIARARASLRQMTGRPDGRPSENREAHK